MSPGKAEVFHRSLRLPQITIRHRRLDSHVDTTRLAATDIRTISAKAPAAIPTKTLVPLRCCIMPTGGQSRPRDVFTIQYKDDFLHGDEFQHLVLYIQLCIAYYIILYYILYYIILYYIILCDTNVMLVLQSLLHSAFNYVTTPSLQIIIAIYHYTTRRRIV
jgi:hypothetical protein